MGILQRVETLSGRPVVFKPDSSLTLRATLQLARNGAPTHVLRYRPANVRSTRRWDTGANFSAEYQAALEMQ